MKFGLVSDGAASKLDANSAERAAGFSARSLVRITVSHCDCCVMVGTVVEKKVIVVAVDRGEGAVGQVHTRSSPPEVDAIVAGDCRRPSRYVPYKGTFVPYDGTFGASDQGQTLDV